MKVKRKECFQRQNQTHVLIPSSATNHFYCFCVLASIRKTVVQSALFPSSMLSVLQLQTLPCWGCSIQSLGMVYRIIESFGLEGTPRGHLVQPPRSEQGHR